MDAKRYPISSSILHTYTGAGFTLIAVSVVSFLVALAFMGSLGSSAGRATTTASYDGRAGGIGVVMLLVGLSAALGSRVPFQRARAARGSYVELNEDGLVWVKTAGDQVSIRWSEIKDVYATDMALNITGASAKAELPAEFEDFADLVSTVQGRTGRG